MPPLRHYDAADDAACHAAAAYATPLMLTADAADVSPPFRADMPPCMLSALLMARSATLSMAATPL